MLKETIGFGLKLLKKAAKHAPTVGEAATAALVPGGVALVIANRVKAAQKAGFIKAANKQRRMYGHSGPRVTLGIRGQC